MATGPKVNRESRCECVCVCVRGGGQSSWSKSQNRVQGETFGHLSTMYIDCHLRLFAFIFSSIHNQAEKVTTSNLPILGLRALFTLALRDSCLPLPLCTPSFVPQLPAQTPMPHRLS